VCREVLVTCSSTTEAKITEIQEGGVEKPHNSDATELGA